MATGPLRLLGEALVLGVGVAVLFLLVHLAAMKAFGNRAMTHHGLLLAQVALVGGATHVLCEVTGLNAWYCAQRND